MSLLSNMRIGSRLSLGFGIVCLVGLVPVGIAFFGMQGIMAPAERIAQQALPGIDSLRNFQAMQESMFTYSQGLMLEPPADVAADYLKAWSQNNKDATAALDRYEKLGITEANEPLMPKMKKAWEGLVVADGHVVDLYRKSVGEKTKVSLQAAKDYAAGPENKAYNESVAILQKMIENEQARAKAEIEAAGKANRNAVYALGAATALSLLVTIVISVFAGRGITKTLLRISGSLSEGATQVESGSAQLSSSSHTLADGSSESAASLEETASAMEEMSAMTKRNAESAGEAKALSDRASSSVDKANVSMESLVGRMAEISSAGEEIGKIIKTIDEIAFQTNLLALNAAVEAARAGEAGAGFAVVADEVRNLAQRAAGAARNTSDLIEGVIRKIQDGTHLVEKTSDDFSEVASSVKKVTELVGEVSAASSEQSRGIGEVSQAIARMEKVTQNNAASAEEVASASQEMSSQALALQEIVVLLGKLTSGRGSVMSPIAARPARVAPKPGARKPVRALGSGSPSRPARPKGAGKTLAPKSTAPRPADVIPFDDDEDANSF